MATAGPIAALGWLAELTGRWRALRRDAIPVIAIHPADVRRGYLPITYFKTAFSVPRAARRVSSI